jgi:spore germination protein (amino acid permease)
MDKLNSRHIIFLICGTSIVSLKTYPTVFTKTGGRDSWIGIIISSILIILYFLYIIRVCKKTNTYSFYKVFQGAFGKILGTIFMTLFMLTLFITLVESSAVEANSMHTNMLLRTPQWFFLIFFIIPAIYTVKKGKVAIMSVTIVGIILIMLAGINLAMLTAKYKKIQYLFPIFENGITLGFIDSILKTLALYGSIAIVLPYLSEIKDTKKLTRDSLIGLLIVIQMEIISLTGMIMTFGINRANLISYPKLIQTQRVSLFDFLEMGELFVMLQIVGGWFIKYVLTFFAFTKLLKDLNINNKYIHYIISTFVFLFAFAAANNLFTLFRLLNYYTYIALVGFIIIPLTAFIMYDIKNHFHKIK